MNLFNNPSLHSLEKLIMNAQPDKNAHNVVLDFDGEVIIDPEVHYPNVAINRFKYYTKINHIDGTKPSNIKALYANLLKAFDPGIFKTDEYRDWLAAA